MIYVDDIYEAFKRYYYSEVFPIPDRPDVFHVTELCDCPLKTYLIRKHLLPISLDKMVILCLGRAVHEVIEKYLPIREVGFEVEGKTTLNGRFTVIGRADILTDYAVYDIKTVNKIPDKPFEHHEMQVTLYTRIFDKQQAHIIYIAKDKGKIAIFRANTDEKYVREAERNAEILYDALTSNTPPKPVRSWRCNYCENQLYCWG